MDSLFATLRVAESGLDAQSSRLKIVSQNMANKDNTALIPGGTPYRRKLLFFRSTFDAELQASKVEVAKYDKDHQTPFIRRFQPYHPAADTGGYVYYPNVDSLVELADSKEAERSYQLNLNMLSLTAGMINRIISIISNKQ